MWGKSKIEDWLPLRSDWTETIRNGQGCSSLTGAFLLKYTKEFDHLTSIYSFNWLIHPEVVKKNLVAMGETPHAQVDHY
jgi:hypothetical protein